MFILLLLLNPFCRLNGLGQHDSKRQWHKPYLKFPKAYLKHATEMQKLQNQTMCSIAGLVCGVYVCARIDHQGIVADRGHAAMQKSRALGTGSEQGEVSRRRMHVSSPRRFRAMCTIPEITTLQRPRFDSSGILSLSMC